MEVMHPSELANRYARLPYHVVFEDDECEGKPCVFARVFEMPDCVGWGWTREEAAQSSLTARADFIQSLMDDGLEIPLPITGITMQATPGVVWLNPSQNTLPILHGAPPAPSYASGKPELVTLP